MISSALILRQVSLTVLVSTCRVIDMEISSYMFVGVGVAISVLGFFLKKNKTEIEVMKERLRASELTMTKMEERTHNLQKVSEDRRKDIQKIFEIVNRK